MLKINNNYIVYKIKDKNILNKLTYIKPEKIANRELVRKLSVPLAPIMLGTVLAMFDTKQTSQNIEKENKANHIKDIVKKLHNRFDVINFNTNDLLELCKENGEYNSKILDLVYKHLIISERAIVMPDVISNIKTCKVNDKFSEDALRLYNNYLDYISTRSYVEEFTEYADICKYNDGAYSRGAVDRISYGFLNPMRLSKLKLSIKDFDLSKYSSEDLFVEKLINHDRFFVTTDAIKRAKKVLEYIEKAKGNENKEKIIDKLLSDKDNSSFLISWLLDSSKDYAVKGMIFDEEIPNELIYFLYSEDKIMNTRYIEDLKSINIKKKFEEIKKMLLKAPELYISDDIGRRDVAENAVLNHLMLHGDSIVELIKIFDKATIETIMRKRFDDADIYCEILKKLSSEEKNLLLKIQKCSDINDKPLSIKNKMDFLEIIDVLKDNKEFIQKLSKMVDNGKIDLDTLYLDIFKYALQVFNFNDKEIEIALKDGKDNFDISKIYLVLKSYIYNKKIASDIYGDDFETFLKLMLLNKDFKSYINDPHNEFGKSNSITKTIFENNKMDYQKWVNPDKNLEVRFQSDNEEKERLKNIAVNLVNDIEELRRMTSKKYIDRQISEFIIDDKVVLSSELITNREKLEKFIKKVIFNFNKIWVYSRRNIEKLNMDKHVNASKNLAILDKFEQYLSQINAIEKSKKNDELDITIKMWDRNPKKDIYQGNYSTCCVAMGETNAEALLQYMFSTSFNMIELVDNKSGEIMGNALCYFLLVNNEPSFVIDNIEINNNYIFSEDVSKNLSSAIVKYAKNISEAVTGDKNTKIYLGSDKNDVINKRQLGSYCKTKFIGDIPFDSIYIDFRFGWIDMCVLDGKAYLYKIS